VRSADRTAAATARAVFVPAPDRTRAASGGAMRNRSDETEHGWEGDHDDRPPGGIDRQVLRLPPFETGERTAPAQDQASSMSASHCTAETASRQSRPRGIVRVREVDRVRQYEWPPGVLALESDGTGALLLPTGRLKVIALDSDSHPMPGVACVAYPDVEGAYEPRPVPMPTTDPTGVCLLSLAATGYRIALEVGAGPPVVIAVGRAIVAAGELTEVTIRIK
jgi:hypothetical protein